MLQHGFQELLARNEAGKRVRTITDNEIIHMGAKAYSIIAKSFERLQEERILIAYTPLPLTKSPDCIQNHDTCIKSWRDGWVAQVGKGLLSPKDAVPLSKLPDLIWGTYFIDLDYCCKIDTLSALFLPPMLSCPSISNPSTISLPLQQVPSPLLLGWRTRSRKREKWKLKMTLIWRLQINPDHEWSTLRQPVSFHFLCFYFHSSSCSLSFTISGS